MRTRELMVSYVHLIWIDSFFQVSQQMRESYENEDLSFVTEFIR